MIQLTKEQIREVADEFDTGFRCYYNIETKEIKSIIDRDKHFDIDEDIWEDEFNEIDENPDKYVEIDPPDTDYNFKIMENFVDTVDDKQIHDRLIYALNRSKPFRNFKYEIDYSDEYRQKWFDFKRKMLESWVQKQIDFLNDEG